MFSVFSAIVCPPEPEALRQISQSEAGLIHMWFGAGGRARRGGAVGTWGTLGGPRGING